MQWTTLLTTFGMIFLAEMGDKTQLMVLTLSAKTRSPWAVFAGATLALTVVSLVAALAGAWVSRYLPEGVLHKVAGGLFIVLGGWMLFGKG